MYQDSKIHKSWIKHRPSIQVRHLDYSPAIPALKSKDIKLCAELVRYIFFKHKGVMQVELNLVGKLN